MEFHYGKEWNTKRYKEIREEITSLISSWNKKPKSPPNWPKWLDK